MKRLFSIALVALLALFTACNSEEINGGANFQLTSSNTKDVSAEGGAVLFTYTIKNRIQGASVETIIISGNDAVKNIMLDTDGIIAVNVKANSGSEGRLIIIKAIYGSDSFDVVINQKSSNGGSISEGGDVEFEGAYLNGYYYGQEYGVGADLYAFFISDKGMNNAGQIFANGTYYYIYAFAPMNSGTILPNGTYNYSANETFTQYTVVGEYSKLYNTGVGSDDTVITPITNAKMVVSANRIVLELTIDGKRHKVTYNGSLELQDATEDDNGDTGGDSSNNNNPTDGQDGEAKSTYTSDHNVTFNGEHRAKWGYEGDYWNTGYSNYTIFIMNKSNDYVFGDTLQFDLITDNKSEDGDFDGKYTISNTPGKMVMMAGFTNKYAQAVGSWLLEYGSGSDMAGFANYAMLKSGTAEFIKNSDGTHTVKLNAYDCLGNNITCNWTGVIEKD